MKGQVALQDCKGSAEPPAVWRRPTVASDALYCVLHSSSFPFSMVKDL